jgi:hypothetical protein
MDDHDTEDQELADAYARLGTALLPPPDVAVRVEREVVSRRRRRRTAMAGGAAVVVAGTIAGAIVLDSGDSPDGDTVAVDRPGAQGSFTLTRADGTSVTFDDLTLSCDEDPMGRKPAPGTLFLYSPFHMDASGEQLTEPYFFVSVKVDEADGTTFTLPVEDDRADGEPTLMVFAAESGQPGGKRANEVSSAQGDAAGTVEVRRAACGSSPVLDLDVDTTLGSELNQPSEQLVGSFG